LYLIDISPIKFTVMAY